MVVALTWPASDLRRVTILGATGSIGQSTLDLIGAAPERYEVVALTGQRNVERLAAAARRHRAQLAVVGDPAAYASLKDALAGSGVEVAGGPQGLIEAAERSAEWVMAAIVGAAGLEPTLAAVRRGAMARWPPRKPDLRRRACSRRCGRAAPCCCRSIWSTTRSFRRSRASATTASSA